MSWTFLFVLLFEQRTQEPTRVTAILNDKLLVNLGSKLTKFCVLPSAQIHTSVAKSHCQVIYEITFLMATVSLFIQSKNQL